MLKNYFMKFCSISYKQILRQIQVSHNLKPVWANINLFNIDSCDCLPCLLFISALLIVWHFWTINKYRFRFSDEQNQLNVCFSAKKLWIFEKATSNPIKEQFCEGCAFMTAVLEWRGVYMRRYEFSVQLSRRKIII